MWDHFKTKQAKNQILVEYSLPNLQGSGGLVHTTDARYLSYMLKVIEPVDVTTCDFFVSQCTCGRRGLDHERSCEATCWERASSKVLGSSPPSTCRLRSEHRHDAGVQCGLFDVDHDDSVGQVLEKSGPDAGDDFDESDISR